MAELIRAFPAKVEPNLFISQALGDRFVAIQFTDTYKLKGLPDHSFRVAYIADDLARQDGVEWIDRLSIVKAGLLHDVGRRDLPDYLWLKGKITSKKERALLETHVVLSYNRIHPFAPEIADILIGHHRFQYNGYPRVWDWSQYSEKTERFQLYLFYADQAEALMSGRSYKPAWHAQDTFEHLMYMRHEPRLAKLAIKSRMALEKTI